MSLYRIEYWKHGFDGLLTQGTPEDYTFRRIQVINCGERRGYLQFDFEKDENEWMFGQIQAALTFAFEAGQRAKSQEIRNALGV